MVLEPPLSKLQLLKNIESKKLEKIFFHKLAYDLKVSAIKSNQNLHVYEVEVDDEGYDIIVDDGFDRTRKFQLKTRLNPGGATSWGCQQQLFCPTPNQENKWQFNEWINRQTWGYNGGFILIDIEWNEGLDPKVIYRYCDLTILMAIRDGFLSCKKKRKTAFNVLKKTYKKLDNKKERIDLPQTMLVQPKDTKCLLSLMGFNIWIPKIGDYTHCFVNSYSSKNTSSPQCLFNALFDRLE